MEGFPSDLAERNGQLDPAVASTGPVQGTAPGYASSGSLSPREQSEPDSDFATGGADTEAGLSRPGSSEDEDWDEGAYGASRR